jgi:hypothetical protein
MHSLRNQIVGSIGTLVVSLRQGCHPTWRSWGPCLMVCPAKWIWVLEEVMLDKIVLFQEHCLSALHNSHSRILAETVIWVSPA